MTGLEMCRVEPEATGTFSMTEIVTFHEGRM